MSEKATKSTLEVNLIWADLTQGIQRDASHCPIARAFQRTFKPFYVGIAPPEIFVDFNDGYGTQRFKLAKGAIDWIKEFDEFGPERLPLGKLAVMELSNPQPLPRSFRS